MNKQVVAVILGSGLGLLSCGALMAQRGPGGPPPPGPGQGQPGQGQPGQGQQPPAQPAAQPPAAAGERAADPGVRTGPSLAGAPLPGLTSGERAIFEQGKIAFDEVDGVDEGLGPRFNLDSCGGCHSAPSTGGTSPALNPQIAAATKLGALNRVPPFLDANGPVRVVRFRRTPDGRPDGGVHALFVITGRSDAPGGCRIQQPDFAQPGNIVFRIPTPVFGLGLIEAIPDSTLRANLAANAARRDALGIHGRFNTNGNDGTITRFGWKAQNKSLQIFSGEAYNVEVGVTNELFPQEREEDPACSITAPVEDRADHDRGSFADVELFTQFMRLLDAPRTAPSNASIERGRQLFDATGCAACHTPLLRTGRSSVAALNQKDVRLYSDLALHDMGGALNDGIAQGGARGGDWRTAPLWGLSQRLFFLHDGRARNLVDAILMHDSRGSEASAVIANYNGLALAQQQDLLAFLRSL
ncbi:MAG: di-heme oxidoredictase family protein [Bryobacteraceae bacterium]